MRYLNFLKNEFKKRLILAPFLVLFFCIIYFIYGASEYKVSLYTLIIIYILAGFIKSFIKYWSSAYE